ncbi:helix-turn-helix transcriptional regulator [Kitasatospora viridis]|uniref:Regulatory LuxR family protein n=1 Tax=Kitasatospora viridis TaxID=281105 RepID=A0A561TSL9_9ACTN|nr:LuxR family transcriptional regulator [Kitasatospora viridis]TWF90113.1 regulatory LuxR family protein [Kitasatospora viridis]
MTQDLDDGLAAHGGRFPLVGRRRELGRLLAALRNPPAVVLVEGEAGIGKSRLVREAGLLLRAEHHQVLTGFCHPLREPLPYGPVVDALRQADLTRSPVFPPTTGALAPLLPDLAELLGPPPLPPADASAQRFHLVQAVRSFLTALGPTTLVVEDLHWADDATRDLLLLLARDLPPQLGLVLTYRDEDLPPDGAVLGAAYHRQPGTGGSTIRLGPLAEPEVRELAAAALGPHATTALGAALYQRSQGLPLAAEEDLITLAEHGETPGHRGALEHLQDAAVPRGLREVVLERLAVLSPAAVAVAHAAAVLAVPAREELLTALAGLSTEQGAEALTELLLASVLHEDQGEERGAYAFRHVLAQQVVHEHVPTPARLRLHRRAIELLQAQTPVPLVRIAHHTLAAGDRTGWLLRAQEAADQAIAVRDGGTAATLLRRLLDQPELRGEARSRAALSLAAIAAGSVDFRTDVDLLRRLVADPALSLETRGEIRLSLGLGLLTENAVAAGFDEVERAAGELADRRPERAVRAMVALALKEAEGPQYTRAWLERADGAARASGSEALTAAVHATRLTLMACQGSAGVWELTERLPRRAADTELLRQSARALQNVADTASYLGHDRRAAALATEAGQLAAHTGRPITGFLSRGTLLRLDAFAGRWDGLAERLDSFVAEYPTAGGPRAERAVLTGAFAAAQGQLALARDLFGEAARIAAEQLLVGIELRAAAGLCAVHLSVGDPARAWAVADRAVATVRHTAAWPRTAGLLPAAVEAALACGRRTAAEQLGAEAERALRGRDAPAAAADVELVHGLLLLEAEPAAAAGHFAAAVQAWRKIGRPYQTARALEREAGARHRGGPGAADDPLAEALALFTDLGATADAARCKQLQRDLGLVRRGPGRPGYGDGLSPREHQVAGLLTAGATNQQIAESLSLSPRTAENHVAKVLKKLGTSRKLVSSVYQVAPDGDAGT